MVRVDVHETWQWPERPMCHAGEPNAEAQWLQWERHGPYWHCRYCGSLSPKDLLAILQDHQPYERPEFKPSEDVADADAFWAEQKAYYQEVNSHFSLDMADWKYGWPHKFYLHGLQVERGAAKFYNQHLRDLTHKPTFKVVAEQIERYSGVRFEMDDEGRMMYRVTR